MSELKYTQEQLDIAILKNNNEGLLRAISEIKHELKWTMGLIFGLYGLALTGLIGASGHAYGWF